MKPLYLIPGVLLMLLLRGGTTDAALGSGAEKATTSINFTMDLAADVFVAIVDPTGRHVRQLWDGPLPPGRVRFRWDGHHENGRAVAAGTYAIQANGEMLGHIRHRP